MTANGSHQVGQKLWDYVGVLRGDTLSCQDNLEQFTPVHFLKTRERRPVW